MRGRQGLVERVRDFSQWHYRWYAGLLLAFGLFACVMIVAGVSLRLISLRRTVVVTPPLQPVNVVREQPALILSVGIPYINAKPVLPDLCFDFLKSLEGRSIVLDSAADLNALYDQADTSDLCPTTATRYEFDFAKYQIVGAVTSGTGCSLDLTYQATVADDLARTQTIELTHQVIGTCAYELVRPLWLAIERNGYTMSIKIS